MLLNCQQHIVNCRIEDAKFGNMRRAIPGAAKPVLKSVPRRLRDTLPRIDEQ